MKAPARAWGDRSWSVLLPTLPTLGQLQLQNALAPLGWTLTSIPTDYGVDFDVEVFENNKATRVTFKVQLKSSQSTAYAAKGDFVSEPIPSSIDGS